MYSLFESLRKSLFWLIDGLKGRPLYNHLREIDDILNSYNIASQELRKKDLLLKLLKHATLTTNYYGKYNNQIDLLSFPVINKSIIRENFGEFVSGAFSISELIPVVTSGSTGTPFKTLHNKNKRLRNHADTIFFAKRAGYEIGHRLLYLKIWAKQKMRSPIHYWMQNIVPVDVIKLNDKQIEAMIREMERNHSKFGFLGYSSALEQICKYLDKKGINRVNTNVASIISISESLNEYTKKTMEKYFGIPAVSRYSNLENGIIAQQDPNSSNRYLVNTASYMVEILNMYSDETVTEGKPGRIVITDLFNYAMPMIRYDTGDIGAFINDPEQPGRQFLSTVEGRILDLIYNTEGHLVSSYLVYKNMWQYTEIIQYQLIQEGKKQYTFKINVNGNFGREAQLVNEFKSYLGKDADFRVEYVSEIPLLASGKRKKIVNNYTKL